MKKSRYYIRITECDNNSLQDYLARNGIEATFISTDIINNVLSIMYTAILVPEEAGALRLSFNFVGFLNFNRALN
jgi:fibronectin type 3 domain-containing protein